MSTSMRPPQEFSIGDRVVRNSYGCYGTITEIEWGQFQEWQREDWFYGARMDGRVAIIWTDSKGNPMPETDSSMEWGSESCFNHLDPVKALEAGRRYFEAVAAAIQSKRDARLELHPLEMNDAEFLQYANHILETTHPARNPGRQLLKLLNERSWR